MPDDSNTKGWLSSLPNDSVAKTLIVAIGLCLVCSVIVSTTAVALKPLQLRNAVLARQIEILRVAGLMEEGGDVDVLFEQVEVRVVNLDTGEFVDDIDGATYDQRKAAKDPSMSDAISPDADVAGIQRRARYAPIYLVKDGDEIETIILPIHGYGLWSTMYGFLALEGDATTVKGLTFYEDGETPGLGGEINNPRWQARWVGRQLFDDQGEARLRVIRGSPDPNSPEAIHQVDGISGATLTVNGVNNAVEYWFGGSGFGPFLARLREQGGAA